MSSNMYSQKQKRHNGFNKNRNGLNDGYITIDEDINQSTIIRHQPSTVLIGESPVITSNNTQQVKIIKLNGKLYVPVQQEYLHEKTTNKHVYNEAPPTNMMNHHIDNNLNYTYGNTLATPDNYHHLLEKSNSTPKRSREQLNKSNEQKKKARHEDGNYQQQTNRLSPKGNIPSQGSKINMMSSNYRQTATTTKTNINKSYTIPMDHLKRAVGCNLPCFMIELDKNVAPRNLPSAVIACDLIKDHFNKNNIDINGFSVALFVGHRLKIGINNMEDYSKFVRTDKWPTSINGKKIELNKPKFVPECFTLVVRYVPQELSIQNVADEIKRSINSADNFKQIMYSFNRPTKDIRFTISDLAEYEGALKLGRLCIANRLHPVTRYLPANKLTFCTNCWQIGHVRTSCNSNVRKCRICLKVFDRGHMSKCSGKPCCAQCGLDHHSLDPNCEYIQNYRQKLNQEVKQAFRDGTINRRTVQLHHQHQVPHPGSSYDIDYSPVSIINNNTKMVENKIWSRTNSQLVINNSTFSSTSITSMLVKMNQDLKNEMHSIKEMILEKLDEKININSSNIQLHQVSLCTINSTITKILQNVLLPMVNLIPDSNLELKQQISSAVQELEVPFRLHANHMRKNFNIGHNKQQSNNIDPTVPINNKINLNQPPSLSPLNDTPTLIEDSDRMVDDN
ncbi:unnamed protein product [Rotaria sp. Silwood1]|nr:unnamed protein product [Rotaria sp. Silwood1]CAF1663146.1 unnamed protein product [Rotaria sp. Silwood1]CAF3781843.1 unnamed protein product [Rotaria sp. Silwood1]CAF3884706.1 unnamed protein product [Rotaria sp. Silwood1]CAF3908121.1 unnamed protein product [Rotaria sp. Silwood1]